jgi:hypothetical protein
MFEVSNIHIFLYQNQGIFQQLYRLSFIEFCPSRASLVHLASNTIIMKTLLGSLFIAITIAFSACQPKSNDHNHDEETSDALEVSGNQTLYEEVMDIHDEVMPKMEDLHRKKIELQKKAKESGVTEDQKKQYETTIARLDSASESMMVWMNEFNPMPDSVAGEEKAREYLENEMEKIKKVKENILQALQESN